MYKRILAAVDGSDASDLALQEALKLAREAGARLRIVHVVDTVPAGAGGLYVDSDAYRKASLQAGGEVLDRAAAMARQAGVDAEPAVVETESYHPSASIVEEASRWPADLIVMGTHGRSELLELLLGSVAEGVVRHAPVPVLLVRSARTAPEKTAS